MAYLAGWKDILRPIRDGYRHLFPSPDTGPTPGEREKQRHLDRLKGFTYFDTFDQLEAWTDLTVDPIQRANTPLVVRPSAVAEGEEQKANVLICHDYSGNYHEYESTSAIGVDKEFYWCQYLQYVESFIYFSHKLVCVPPPSWTNTLHRNGVKAFGTLLIEPQTNGTERLLHSTMKCKEGRNEIDFPLAHQLSDIARHHGFDGWLINIEKPFPGRDWELGDLGAFLRQLKELMGPSKELVWYDALTKDNKVAYQNGLNNKNIAFAATCGVVLTNYSWNERNALSSKEVALKNGLPVEKVYFGIDVWAQNTVDFGLPRVTYPEVKGGGTNTGIAVSKLAEIGLSAGVFAPAWSFEHFPQHSRSVECAMWEGRAYGTGTACSCRGGANYCHPINRSQPIVQYATSYPAGSERFFFTDFSRPFATHHENEAERLYENKTLHSQLGSQSIIPHLEPPFTDAWTYNQAPIDRAKTQLRYAGDRTLLCVDAVCFNPELVSKDRIYDRDLPLFKLNMPSDGSLQLTLTCAYFPYVRQSDFAPTVMSIYLKFTDGIRFIPLGDFAGFQIVEDVVHFDCDSHADARLQELGVRITSPAFPESLAETRGRLLQIYEISIVPRGYLALEHGYLIHDVKIEKRGEGACEHWRLRWAYLENRGENNGYAFAPSGMPYSNTTGPFSYFAIQIDGIELGRAYALEHVLPKTFVESLGGKGVTIVVAGVGFDGREIARYEQKSVHT
ncbi:hypothetical protein SLS60_006466 [Paraconiothyrium brasiliense]|uniref:Cytosolic endo-beta-N-acetylglucosaminidase TIM barrel domain-containing protein n=1 Tax=Paraconiothyrium brasiliense TaxID=300254 RepID=A0ABR3RAW1_9PLEO